LFANGVHGESLDIVGEGPEILKNMAAADMN
jgi:hypothetical protein